MNGNPMIGGGLLGGMGIDPMSRFLETDPTNPYANAPNMGQQALQMGVGQKPSMMTQLGQAAGRFGDVYGAMQGVGAGSQPAPQPLGLLSTGGGAPAMPMPAPAPAQPQMSPYMQMLNSIIGGAYD